MWINLPKFADVTGYYEGYFKSFASLIRSSQKINKVDLKLKKLYFPGYNRPTFWHIDIPSEAFFVSIDESVDACGIPYQVLLFDGLPLQGLSLVLIHPTLNFCTCRSTVDFVLIFCAPYTIHTFSCEFLYSKHFLVLKIEWNFVAHYWAQPSSLFFSSSLYF